MPQPELARDAWRSAAGRTIALPWRLPLLHLALAWSLLSLLMAGDWADMARQWLTSSTYNHMLFVPAICGWLVFLRHRDLAQLTPRAWWPGLLLVAAALFLWLLGAVSGTNSARHLGAVMATEALVVALLGPRVAVALAFPLAYLLFLVPFGEELVPQMQMVTARITTGLVVASGIPAHIDGVLIDTPAGLFEVAEACSGVKFLVAMAALGALMAHLCFRSWRRRMVFMAAALALPVLANGVRAWATIYVAQIKGSDAATSWDHVVYGWFFFALVMVLLALAARPFFDRPADEHCVDVDALMASRLLDCLDRQRISGRAAVLAVAGLALGAMAWASAASRVEGASPHGLMPPPVPGWHVVTSTPGASWKPQASGAEARWLARYANGAGHQVDLFLAIYPAARADAEPGGYGEGALAPDDGWSWLGEGPQFAGAKSEYLMGEAAGKRLAVTYYRSGDVLTGNRLRLRLAIMRDKLLFRLQPVGVLIVSAQDGPRQGAAKSVSAFLAAIGPVGAWMDRAVERP